MPSGILPYFMPMQVPLATRKPALSHIRICSGSQDVWRCCFDVRLNPNFYEIFQTKNISEVPKCLHKKSKEIPVYKK
jgi:hypothetical protein